MIEKTVRLNKMDGEYKMWYENGILKQKAFYHKDKIEGKMECWFANRIRQSEENYLSGLKSGKAQYWDEQGNIQEEKFFRNDTLNGAYRMWYTTGILRIEGSYRDGLYDGNWHYYSDYGLLVGEGKFDHGSGILTGYDARGHIIHVVHYQKNKKEGEEIQYDPKGKVLETKIFKQDRLIRVMKGS